MDKIAAYGIGGLIAGKALAKACAFPKKTLWGRKKEAAAATSLTE